MTEKVPVTFSIKKKTYLKAFELINKTIPGWRMYKWTSNKSVPVPLMRWHKRNLNKIKFVSLRLRCLRKIQIYHTFFVLLPGLEKKDEIKHNKRYEMEIYSWEAFRPPTQPVPFELNPFTLQIDRDPTGKSLKPYTFLNYLNHTLIHV